MLAELAPVGAVETMMAERVVSLWWRLKRAERMQNQAIQDKIGSEIKSDEARHKRDYYYTDMGIFKGDPGYDLDGLPLGRIGNKDFANARILERMMLYERRIESSLNRAMRELERFQKNRRTEQKKAASAHAIPKAFGFEAATPARNHHRKKDEKPNIYTNFC